MRNLLKSAIKKLPIIQGLIEERDKLQSELSALKRFVPPGHFFSPIPCLEEIKKDESRIFGDAARSLIGIDLNESEQLALLQKIAYFYKDLPFQAYKVESLRYYYENPAYSYSDGIMLYGMIRHLKPKRIVEVGSGFSSCVTLDTNELFFDDTISITFIEPYPDLLMSLIKEKDKKKIRVLACRLQDIDLNEFATLQEGDILFIDSTHVSKINSDVNRIFFEILPRLRSGVYIHFHDIFYPFEYPKEWVYEGRAWNEAYTLRTFLQYNTAFRVVLMNTFMEKYYESFFREQMPLCLKNSGGSIWIRKV